MGDPIKKITVNIPEELLSNALRLTGKGITETIIEGLREVEKREKRSALRDLKGKLDLNLDLSESRR